MVGDDAGEDIEAAGGGFRIGGGADIARQLEALHQRNDVDAAGLQHGAADQAELVQLDLGEPVGDQRLRTGQEAGAHAIGDLAEPEIEARRLDLVGIEPLGGPNGAGLGHLLDDLCRQDPDRQFLGHEHAPRFAAAPHGRHLGLAEVAIDAKVVGPYDTSRSWSFEPAGLQPR